MVMKVMLMLMLMLRLLLMLMLLLMLVSTVVNGRKGDDIEVVVVQR